MSVKDQWNVIFVEGFACLTIFADAVFLIMVTWTLWVIWKYGRASFNPPGSDLEQTQCWLQHCRQWILPSANDTSTHCSALNVYWTCFFRWKGLTKSKKILSWKFFLPLHLKVLYTSAHLYTFHIRPFQSHPTCGQFFEHRFDPPPLNNVRKNRRWGLGDCPL